MKSKISSFLEVLGRLWFIVVILGMTILLFFLV